MEFSSYAVRSLAFGSLLAVLTTPAFAHTHTKHYKPNQVEAIFGYNNSSHSNNHLHGGVYNTALYTLHETDNGNDFMGGVGYAYDILPWFVAYHGKDLKHSALQRVWIGLDLLFMNTTESGDMYIGDDPAFNFYDFELEEKTSRLMVNTEVDFNFPVKNLFPFVQASVGAARIGATFEATPDPDVGFTGGEAKLSQEINYNLAYSLGAGLKYLFNPHFQVQASYLYTDFGIVKTERESSTLVLSEPITDHLYTNSALLTFSYLF